MNHGYKVLLMICILLIILSLFHDLNKQTFTQNTVAIQYSKEIIDNPYVVVQIRAKSGDTILSLVEEVNEQLIYELNIDEIMADFRSLNPEVHALQLQIGKWYKIPKYIKKG